MQRPRRALGIVLVLVATAAIAAYVLYEARGVLAGTALALEVPQDGTATDEPLLAVSGESRNITSLTLNGRPLLVDESGRFADELLLAPGYTILTLRAEDRFGRELVIRRRVIYNHEEHANEKADQNASSSTETAGDDAKGGD